MVYDLPPEKGVWPALRAGSLTYLLIRQYLGARHFTCTLYGVYGVSDLPWGQDVWHAPRAGCLTCLKGRTLTCLEDRVFGVFKGIYLTLDGVYISDLSPGQDVWPGLRAGSLACLGLRYFTLHYMEYVGSLTCPEGRIYDLPPGKDIWPALRAGLWPALRAGSLARLGIPYFTLHYMKYIGYLPCPKGRISDLPPGQGAWPALRTGSLTCPQGRMSDLPLGQLSDLLWGQDPDPGSWSPPGVGYLTYLKGRIWSRNMTVAPDSSI